MKKRILIVSGREFLFRIHSLLSVLGLEIIRAQNTEEAKRLSSARDIEMAILDQDEYRSRDRKRVLSSIMKKLVRSRKKFMMVSSQKTLSALLEAKARGASDYVIRPFNYREFIARFNAISRDKKRLASIGGGTGLFHLLLGLKGLSNTLLTSIVSMADDGGSSGRLRASFGILPPGDVRRSLVALSNAPEIMNQIMQYRFMKGGGVKGHSFGNLFLTALTEIKGSLPRAVKTISDILNVQGIVIPVTDALGTLRARFKDGTVVEGESRIDLSEGRSPGVHLKELSYKKKVECNTDAFEAILNADVLIIGPGDLYTSVIASLLVGGISEAIRRTGAKKVYICNLMTKPGETAHFKAEDHIREIVKYLGGDYLDYVIISDTKLSREAIKEYKKKNQAPVTVGDLKKIREITRAKIILADVGDEKELVRHDERKIAAEIGKLLKK